MLCSGHSKEGRVHETAGLAPACRCRRRARGAWRGGGCSQPAFPSSAPAVQATETEEVRCQGSLGRSRNRPVFSNNQRRKSNKGAPEALRTRQELGHQALGSSLAGASWWAQIPRREHLVAPALSVLCGPGQGYTDMWEHLPPSVRGGRLQRNPRRGLL